MKRFFWFLFIAFFLLASCRSLKDGEIYQQVSGDDIQVGFVEDTLLTLEVAYIGAIGHSYIFECTIENISSKEHVLDKSQFTMELNDNEILYPVNEDLIVGNLAENRSKLKKRKKDFTILSGIMVGLGVIAGASEGLNVGEVIAYNADPLFAIFDERRWYQRNIESVEDEIEYIRSAQFRNYRLNSLSHVTRDLLFPTTKVKSDVDIIFTIGDLDYVITFPKKIFR